MADDIFADDKAEIEQLEKPQREDKGTAAPAEKPEPAQTAPEPQAPAPDTEDEVEIENKGRFVRYGALREAREQNKALKEERDRIVARRHESGIGVEREFDQPFAQ